MDLLLAKDAFDKLDPYEKTAYLVNLFGGAMPVFSQRCVMDFHTAFDILISPSPTLADEKTRSLRVELIREEFRELMDAYDKEDIVEVADALGDLIYVVVGAALSHGIDIAPVFAEIHRSNMSKVGGFKREDGKWEKPETYSKANLRPILEAQGLEPEEGEEELCSPGKPCPGCTGEETKETVKIAAPHKEGCTCPACPLPETKEPVQNDGSLSDPVDRINSRL